MKYLIVGLGNPGIEYENTRHNVGFRVLDKIAGELETSFVLDRAAFVSYAKYKGRSLVLIKPITFMNLSGKAVNYWMQKEGVSIENILVITDDLALPFGKLRMKGSGSDGGHNGLKDIQHCLGSTQYARLRFGIGSDFSKGRQSDYVLGKWEKEEELALPERLLSAAKMGLSFCSIGLALTMTEWNGK
jgi:PTH1 family peptidyl-tRNA hydrolase